MTALSCQDTLACCCIYRNDEDDVDKSGRAALLVIFWHRCTRGSGIWRQIAPRVHGTDYPDGISAMEFQHRRFVVVWNRANRSMLGFTLSMLASP